MLRKKIRRKGKKSEKIEVEKERESDEKFK